MFSQKYYFLISFLFLQFGFTQTWQGRILSTHGNPLAHAVVSAKNHDIWTFTDEFGFFHLKLVVEDNDSLSITRYGYQTVVLPFNSRTANIIYLTPVPVKLAPVNVIKSVQSATGESIMYLQEKYFPDIDHETLLSAIPGITIRTYGGPGSLSTIGLDGGPANQTKILLNGFDLTNSQNGVVDLSQIPTAFIESAGYLPPNDIQSGLGSSSGTVMMNPWNGNSEINISTGSYGYSSANLKYKTQWDSSILRVLGGRKSVDGDYSATWRNRTVKRENNNFDQIYTGLQYHTMWKSKYYLKLMALSNQNKRGIPGLIYSPSKGRRNDTFAFTGLKTGWITANGAGDILLSIKHVTDDFIDPPIDSKHELLSGSLKTQFKYTGTNVTGNIFMSFNQDEIVSTETQNHSRLILSNGLDLSVRYWDKLQIRPGYRIDYCPQKFMLQTSALSFIYSPAFYLIESLSLRWGNHHRVPTFNELYWQPGGDPNLNPEATESYTIISNLHLNRFGQLTFQGFYYSSQDLIQWRPALNYWKPENIEKSKRSGWKFQWKFDLSNYDIRFHLTYSRIYSEYLVPGAHFKKPLKYTPDQIGSMQLMWNPNDWSIQIQSRYSGDMISLYDWPKDITIQGVILYDARIAYLTKFSKYSINTILAVENLTNIAYERSKNFPEPGRSFRITTALQLK